ncbi:cupin domain-containing protein [Methylobacterium segetis]|uniref:cupin domain-containing protein n=1 Tax=Methylobacterium segetis TaxID=2488750 RepID=UPI001049CDA4|nr:cupin domain-containing protein [Methylobacterium segetis]
MPTDPELPTDPVPTCRVVGAGAAFIGKQGLTYAPAISAETVGARGLHMQIVTIPPGAWAKAHKHENHETAIHILSGRSGTWYGERLEHHLVAGPGDFVYIPANMPHRPYNLSATEPCIAVIARTDPNEQESVVVLPDLDALHAEEREAG